MIVFKVENRNFLGRIVNSERQPEIGSDMKAPSIIAQLMRLPERPILDLIGMLDTVEKEEHLGQLIDNPAIELRALPVMVKPRQSLVSEPDDLHMAISGAECLVSSDRRQIQLDKNQVVFHPQGVRHYHTLAAG
jgi:hypothetical protein